MKLLEKIEHISSLFSSICLILALIFNLITLSKLNEMKNNLKTTSTYLEMLAGKGVMESSKVNNDVCEQAYAYQNNQENNIKKNIDSSEEVVDGSKGFHEKLVDLIIENPFFIFAILLFNLYIYFYIYSIISRKNK